MHWHNNISVLYEEQAFYQRLNTVNINKVTPCQATSKHFNFRSVYDDEIPQL